MYIHPKCLNHFVQHYAYHSVVVDTEAGYAESSVAGGGYGCGVAQKTFRPSANPDSTWTWTTTVTTNAWLP